MCLGAMIIDKLCWSSMHYCPGWEFFSDDHKDTFTIFRGHGEASKAGWQKTDDLRWCRPDQQYVYVCPECIKECGFPFANRVRYVPVAPDGTEMIDCSARDEHEAWDNLIKVLRLPRHHGIDDLIDRGFRMRRHEERDRKMEVMG